MYAVTKPSSKNMLHAITNSPHDSRATFFEKKLIHKGSAHTKLNSMKKKYHADLSSNLELNCSRKVITISRIMFLYQV
jgi:hypothetical protein